jgi:hypothetical protein
MKVTEAMVRAEEDRRARLLIGETFVKDAASWAEDLPLYSKDLTDTAIRHLMVGSHAGRMGKIV